MKNKYKYSSTNLYGMDIKLTGERLELIEGGWEYQRIKSMMGNIKEGDVVFDIGAEQGDMSALMGKKSGKIVLFEASPMMWPHIRQNFEANDLKPLDCYAGFVSNVTDENPKYLNYDPKMGTRDYPGCAYDKLVNTRGFRHLHEETEATNQITLDDYCERSGIYPDVVTIDVEGSECHVLEGMSKVMDKTMPIVYLSVHHDFLGVQHGRYYNEIGLFFNERGYKAEYLGFDHEMHMCYYKKSINLTKEII